MIPIQTRTRHPVQAQIIWQHDSVVRPSQRAPLRDQVGPADVFWSHRDLDAFLHLDGAPAGARGDHDPRARPEQRGWSRPSSAHSAASGRSVCRPTGAGTGRGEAGEPRRKTNRSGAEAGVPRQVDRLHLSAACTLKAIYLSKFDGATELLGGGAKNTFVYATHYWLDYFCLRHCQEILVLHGACIFEPVLLENGGILLEGDDSPLCQKQCNGPVNGNPGHAVPGPILSTDTDTF